jgi:hypothetical protein
VKGVAQCSFEMTPLPRVLRVHAPAEELPAARGWEGEGREVWEGEG